MDAGAGRTGIPVRAALIDYYAAPGKYQLGLRQPAILFSSIGEILQIAGGRKDMSGQGGDRNAREAASFFIRAAMLFPGADHYALLGLPASASAQELKERYRLLMRLIHPDYAESGAGVWPDDAAIRVNRAYEVLSSPLLRREYDDHVLAGATQRAVADPKPPSRRPSSPGLRDRLHPKTAWATVLALALLAGWLLVPHEDPGRLIQKSALRPAITSTARTPHPGPVSVPDVPRTPPSVPAAEFRTPDSKAREAEMNRPAPPILRPPDPAPPVIRPGFLAGPDGAEPPPRTMHTAAIQKTPTGPNPPFPGLGDGDEQRTTRGPSRSGPAQVTPAGGGTVAAAPSGRAALGKGAAAPVAPTMGEAQPLLSDLLHVLEAGSSQQILRLVEAEGRATPRSQAFLRQYDQLVKGMRPLRLSLAEFRGEARDGVLVVTGRIRLHAGEPTIGSHGEPLDLRAEFASRGGKVVLIGLSGSTD